MIFFADSLWKSFCKKFLLPNSFSFNPNPIFQIAKWALSICALTKQKPFSCHKLIEINDGESFHSVLRRKTTTREGRSLFLEDPEPKFMPLALFLQNKLPVDLRRLFEVVEKVSARLHEKSENQ